jgi:ribonuclease BN (tRNA processing enzyme)
MSRLEVTTIGVGDTFTARAFTTALLVHADGFTLAIDCPDTYRKVLAASGFATTDVGHVILTHVHGDHMNGLEGFAYLKRFAEGKRLGLSVVPEVREVLWDKRLVASMGQLWDGAKMNAMHFDDYFEETPLSWEESTTIGPFTVRTRRTIHHVPTSALLIEYDGKVVGYSADTAFDPALLAWLSPADLVFHETNHGPAHTPYAALEALDAGMREKMRLVHYPDEFDPDRSAIVCARQGERFVVTR